MGKQQLKYHLCLKTRWENNICCHGVKPPEGVLGAATVASIMMMFVSFSGSLISSIERSVHLGSSGSRQKQNILPPFLCSTLNKSQLRTPILWLSRLRNPLVHSFSVHLSFGCMPPATICTERQTT